MRPATYTFQLAAVVGGRRVDAAELTVQVERSAPLALPKLRTSPVRPEAVSFVTCDFVELHGVFYPGRRGKEGACVLLVHDLGTSHRGGDLGPLAQALQAAGHTALHIDLRGHGTSTAVSRGFWDFPANQSLPGGAMARRGKAPRTLSAGFMPPAYFPWLVQDLAAAHAWLESRHDDPDSSVNMDNLVVLGVGEGGSVVALWLAAESHRYPGGADRPGMSGDPAVKSVAGAILVSACPALGGRAALVEQWLALAGRHHGVPLVFVCGGDDEQGIHQANSLLTAVRANSQVPPQTGLVCVPHTKQSGHRLLGLGREVEKIVLDCAEGLVLERASRDWTPRSFRRGSFFWSFPDGHAQVAKTAGSVALLPIPVERLGVH
jgi:pimeloyl-ACP methyl ester carboxylesterase